MLCFLKFQLNEFYFIIIIFEILDVSQRANFSLSILFFTVKIQYIVAHFNYNDYFFFGKKTKEKKIRKEKKRENEL